MLVTIFTPVFNRKHLVIDLYECLLRQSFKDFEWVIVDDGSSDGLEEVVNNLISDNKIKIKYFYKENGGKHTAINLGVKKANGELFFLVDSDDLLVDNALELMSKKWPEINENPLICGIVGLFKFENGNVVGDTFNDSLEKVSFADIYLKYNLKGDKTVAFKTKIMKDYPFPEKKGVKFVFEAVVWHDMAKKYFVICLNEIIGIVNYQQEGLSDSSYKLWYIEGLAFSFFQSIIKNIHPFNKYPKKYISNYIHLASSSLLSNKNYFLQLKSIKSKFIYILIFPRAYFAYLRMRNKVIKREE
ncbi:glycosyltransferase family 2 protein [Lutibacter sp. A80]|uniref:glycosyltransferase family 2 protein n=1 Tax=Lutibacter sp. A80 TaxID=2918453 RepID=UPI001F06DEAD|nr:glycosyltransferase family 2 protein [Lutibacter sp. A80]UMB60339.1 glycosyltransferase family 2 protein [Lutibacter sp. A80]